MPVAFKEWAVTVRALAEGEQLLTLRKGGIREESRHFELDHDRFFLYPTFDHQRNNLVRQSHHPELRRALEEGVWSDGEPPPKALIQDGGIDQPDRVRIRAWAEVHEHYEVDAWLPHCSIAPRARSQQLPVVAATVYGILPLTARVIRAALIDSATGQTWPLPNVP